MNEDNQDALNNLINSIQEKMGNNIQESNQVEENSTSSFDISSLLNVFIKNLQFKDFWLFILFK